MSNWNLPPGVTTQMIEDAQGGEGVCIWEDCDQDAIYCEGHAKETMLHELLRKDAEHEALAAMNENAMLHISRLERDRVRLADVVRAFLRAPSPGSNGPGLITLDVTAFNMDAARDALASLEEK